MSTLSAPRVRPEAPAVRTEVPTVHTDVQPVRTDVHAATTAGPSASRLNWLRAGVLGANDGIVSIAATVVGVAGAATGVGPVAIAGVAALVAGALSMAAGEYVSVSSQRDAEQAMVTRGALDASPDGLTNPWHAAVASLGAFLVGGIVPLLVMLAPWGDGRVVATFVAVLVALTATGVVSARLGGAPVPRAVLRNLLGGSVAMAVTYAIGSLVGLAI